MYGNSHKYFIQFVLKNSYVSYENATTIHKLLADKATEVANTIEQFISRINEEIQKHELRIVITECEITGNKKVILINTSNDQVPKLLGTFTSMELLYFQTILREIITTEGRKISEAICYNLAKSENITLKSDHAEEVLAKWVEMGYFIKSTDHICLGSRCIIEFTSYFHEYFKEYLTECHLCSELVFVGKICAYCDNEFHVYCLERFVTKRQICPNCRKEWKDKHPSLPITNGVHESYESGSSEDDVSDPGPSKRRK